jgi:hypothetical protein
MNVDCYFHSRVPSIAVCRDCNKPLCGTCRDDRGLCPSCRLDERIKTASSARERLSGSLGTSNPPPAPPPQYEAPRPAASTALATITPEMRALLGLSYPLWPLALLSLLSPRRSPQIYRQAVQALALNFGCFGLYFGLGAIAHIPLLGLSALPLLAVLFPIWLVAAVVYGFRVWNGEDVRVPVIAEWLDERERPSTNSA